MTTTEITAIPLTTDEEHDLVLRVAAIHGHLDQIKSHWRDIGDHLRVIRDRRLYRATHSTFEAFVEDEFEFSRQHAYRLIDGAAVAAVVSPTGDIPERQARELIGLEPETAKAVFEEASAGGRPTAAKIAEARERSAPKPKRTDVPPPAEPAATEWSRRVQQVSAEVPMESLTVEQVKWLQGAADFLERYCAVELVDRDAYVPDPYVQAELINLLHSLMDSRMNLPEWEPGARALLRKACTDMLAQLDAIDGDDGGAVITSREAVA